LQGDLASLLPASRAPDVDMPTIISGRRPWGAVLGWSFALLATGCAAFSTWLWWNQGGELAALRTDLAAAYAEAESLRARAAVVSAPAPVEAPPPVSTDATIVEGALPGGDAAPVAPAAAPVDATAAGPVSTATATIAPAVSTAVPPAVPPAVAPAHAPAPVPAASLATTAVATAPATAQPAQAQ
jgi:hypothetical protein